MIKAGEDLFVLSAGGRPQLLTDMDNIETTFTQHEVDAAIEIVRLNPEEKIRGIKVLRHLFGYGLRDTKHLWEIGDYFDRKSKKNIPF
jgi:ribosomal protein L7/L12